MGRKGWFDEVIRWYNQFLAGGPADTVDPPFAIQSVTTGKWRPELQWPPADATTYTSDLGSGTYTDDAQSSATGDSGDGVWTVSKPLPYAVHMAGAPVITADVSSGAPNSNLVADVYDLDATGKGPLVSRQGSVIRSNGTVTLHMMSSDWKFAAGHRIGVRITTNNSEWWIAAVPTDQTVSVYGGTVTFPFLRYNRTQVAQGDSGTTRAAWLGQTETAPAAAVTAARDFTLPAALAPEPADMQAALDRFAGR
jgi:predicted acyl esterase